MFKKQTDQRVAVFFADGCEEIEGLTVVDLLFRAGIPCDKVSISDTYQVTSSHEVTFLCNKRISDIDFDGLLDSVPHSLPALMQAQKLSKRVAKVGFDWDSVEDIWQKAVEERAEYEAETPGSEARAEEFGDLLFVMVQLWQQAKSEE